jgi:hypothetical protein
VGLSNDGAKIHLVDWDTVCSPISEGGLEIRKVRKFNQAFLGKWLWRYAHEEGAWWRSVLEAKYGSSRGGWCTCDITEPHGVGLWNLVLFTNKVAINFDIFGAFVKDWIVRDV